MTKNSNEITSKLMSYSTIQPGQKYNVRTRVSIPSTGIISWGPRLWNSESRILTILDLTELLKDCSLDYQKLEFDEVYQRIFLTKNTIIGIKTLAQTYLDLDILNRDTIYKDLITLATEFEILNNQILFFIESQKNKTKNLLL